MGLKSTLSVLRFIPAGAGNSLLTAVAIGSLSVYPRWRGELTKAANCGICVPGLSPLARGTLSASLVFCHITRFIPAGAGNSHQYISTKACATVYPRWRGELSMRHYQATMRCGLSPLARGTHSQSSRSNACIRFIPAGAGNSSEAALEVAVLTVYPRWRGELCKHNLLLINDFLSQSQSTNFIVSHKQHIHYVKEHLIH